MQQFMLYYFNMKKLGAVVLSLILTGYAYGFEIVYPKTKNPTINSHSTFFIGSSKKPVTINGINVPLHSSGGFAYFVKLPQAINTFTIKDKNKTEVYTIKKNLPLKKSFTQKLIEYKTIKYMVVDVDRTPLRSTAVDGGINRISHLQKGVLLTIDGEMGGFYRVKLNDTKKGWISKKNVIQTEAFTPAIINKYSFKENKNEYILTFELDKKVPYKITEGSSIGLDFYNTKISSHFSFPYHEKTGAKKLWGYIEQYKDNTFILKVRKPPKIDKTKPLDGITITVDAGHGGKEKGAIGCFGHKEKDVVLKISKYLEKELKDKGANVIMTRTDDSYMGLNDRVEKANKNDSVFFVSIHNNALPDSLNPNEHKGTSVYYFYDEAKDFGHTVLNTIVKELGTKNDGLHQQSFAVIRNTGAISILIEVAYLINPEDNLKLINDNFQKNTAKAISDGIEKYIINFDKN